MYVKLLISKYCTLLHYLKAHDSVPHMNANIVSDESCATEYRNAWVISKI